VNNLLVLNSRKSPFNLLNQASSETIEFFDVSTGALWDGRDREVVSKEFERIRSESFNIKHYISWLKKHPEDKELVSKIIDNARSRKRTVIDNFENKLDRVYNDQTNENGFEPLFVTKKEDKVVNTGFTRIAELVVGESVDFFNAMAAGTGSTVVYTGDTELETELARVSLDVSGYATASGSVIKYGAYFSTGVPSASISESGIFDAEVGGDMLLRSVYPANKIIIHTQNSTFFTLSIAIYQSSV
jgi:hypothetical protein